MLLADEIDGFFDPGGESFDLLTLKDLNIPGVDALRFRYPQQPLSYAATPYLLTHLLRHNFSRVVFLKQESLVLGDLTSLFDAVGQRSIALTPHLLHPLDGADAIPRELNILQSGTFNGGVLAVADTPVTHRFLTWWAERAATHCRHAVADGMHYEQRWLDLVPALFEDVHIVRDPAYNVGHWNLPERRVVIRGEAVLVDDEPCRVFRFSGYSPDEPAAVTRYSSRLTLENVGPAREVFERFRLELEAAGFHGTKAWPYAYGAFDNGVPIPDLARNLFLSLGDGATRFGDPFHANAPHSYFRWLNQSLDDRSGKPTGISRLWESVYRARPDLQIAFPDLFGAHRNAFLGWTAEHGLLEYHISDRFLACGVA
ncbi:MAG: hypothetical protein ND807_03765 [Vicinamibacterales bacterium]|nr:hypothetical protein [Vicinamibacterales bacterium]